MISNETKLGLVKKYGKNAKDTGNTFVQIAILTEDIESLKPHFLKNPKDKHSRRGFMAKINKRRVLLDHLKSKNLEEYNRCIKELNLRK
ncbi:30S ribosomal protein S15 [Mycoplasmopsis anatis]|uniref:Small ribosomal subunit protein uS15 n=2 Tax=Mycoplasmopsis anatis TaxID=171279 RepID=F9QD16_9BACT|nr:30S ribosomal protein S15 [Mycoplasmopsis anatis]AWX70286.1 30S ribosomal protein S15 [Mycoplasmopsis anatis]EGS29274.1 30S ribosomal protein S15 [Mycoplasmopsis anatis 1340]MBW0594915.1 30S ribosomal protein S15 [Mycoplasmopsis anatis]MBW0595329.1 30S ribosomal protein S15 [Mycoplasmopsis anatis]MBW0596240.1 30S ribosomal protein S15 [Mycoplasmopsis anatis]